MAAPVSSRPGPLSGLSVVEVASIGPGPFCAMLLADLGADVVRLDRGDDTGDKPLLGRGRRSVAVDLKQADGLDVLLRLVDGADVLLEGFRPGVAERLGFGPDVCFDRNPRLVYGRVTGFGQTGAWSGAAGHDINYIAMAGVLSSIGPAERPQPPLNLVADFGGGGMLLAVGVLSALIERGSSGQGQVVDATMVDGASLLMTMLHEMLHRGMWQERRQANLLDGGTWYYDVYETADGEWVSFGAIEPQFFAVLTSELGLGDLSRSDGADGDALLRKKVAEAVRSRTRQEWEERLGGGDACFAPVLRMSEASMHPYHRERATFVDVDGMAQPAPAPRFSRTPPASPTGARVPGQDTRAVLAELGLSDREILRRLATGAVMEPPPVGRR